MPVVTKVEPIADWITITVDETLSPDAKSKAVAAFARQKLSEAQEKNRQALGQVPPHETFVDGRRDAPLESVKPDGGKIVFEFELVNDVLIWIGETLLERSPIHSGRYRKSHLLFADGVEISIGELLSGRPIPAAEEYSFANPVPYSRKLEIGKTKSGRDFLVSVPNRIYERTATDAKRRFGNVSQIGFTFRGLVGGAQITAGDSRADRREGNKSSNRSPTIIVTARRS